MSTTNKKESRNNSHPKVKVVLDDQQVAVCYDGGMYYTCEQNNCWLWLLGAIHDGEAIKITDERKNLQSHQYDLSGTFVQK